MTSFTGKKTKQRPLRILISGYYGFSNLGDEAILTSIQKALREEYPEVELTVLSANPILSSQLHGIKAISRTDLKTIWKELGRNDLLISGGGSLLQDVTSSRSLQYYLFIMALAKLRRLPYMIYAQGIGPINSKLNQSLTRLILKGAKVITVRDQQSLDELASIGLPQEKLILSADPVLLYENKPSKKAEEILNSLNIQAAQKPWIAVSVRPWGKDQSWLDQIAKALDQVIEKTKGHILFIPMQQKEDEAVALKIRARMKERADVSCLPHGYTVEDVIALMAQMDLVVGVRLHALVFAAIAGTKAIAIRYDPKVDHFAERVGQTLAGRLDKIESDYLSQLILDVLAEKKDLQGHEKKMEELLQAAKLSAKLAIEAAAEKNSRK